MHLTPLSISNLAPRKKRFDVNDDKVRGLTLAVLPSGVKSWSQRYTKDGRVKRYTIGRWPAVNIETARKAADKVLREVASGKDPHAEKLEQRRRAYLGLDRVHTFATIWAQYERRHVDRHTQDRTAREYKRFAKVHFLPRLKNRNITEITPREVKAIFDKMRKSAPVSANRAFAALRAFFTWAESELIIGAEQNPMKTLSKPTAKEGDGRSRVLSTPELNHLWAACVLVKHPFPFGYIVRALMLTGCRLNEIAKMKWEWVNEADKTIVIPQTKNHRSHTLPITKALKVILENCPRDGAFVFTTRKRPPSGFSRAKKRIDAKLKELLGENFEEFQPYTWHDIRRSVASGLLKLGFAPVDIDAVLNHKSGEISGLRAVYMQFDSAEVTKRALTKWGNYLAKIANAGLVWDA